jgi:hypothetical protein
MNPWRVAEEFRLAFAGDADFASASAALVNGQTGANATFPQVSFSATVKPLGRSAQIGIADVTITVETQAQDDTTHDTSGELHDKIVSLVCQKYLGSGSPDDLAAAQIRAQVAATITGRGYLEVDPRITPMGSDPGLVGERFKTDIMLRCGVCFPAT